MPLVGLVMALGCELGDPNTSGPDQSHIVDMSIACGEVPPPCLASCGGETNGTVAACVDGDWQCEAGFTADVCPSYQGACTEEIGCGSGYTCVRSLSHPVPATTGVCRKWEPVRDTVVESCDDVGITSVNQLWDNRVALSGEIVKVAGTLDYAVKCSKNPCSEDDPCCNSCKGHYVLDIADPVDPNVRLPLSIRTETMACGGTTCDVTCGPYQVGETYVMWGVLDECSSSSNCNLLLMGTCVY